MRVVAFALIGLGAALTAANWGALIASFRRKRHISPFIPAASLFTVIGLALLPAMRPYAWIALFTDYTLFSLVMALPAIVVREWRTSSFTRVHLFEASDPPRMFRLSLHRGGHFRVKGRCAPPVLANPDGVLLQSFGFAGRWTKEPEGFRLAGYHGSRILHLLRRNDSIYVSDEENYPADTEYAHDAMEALVFREVD